METNSNSARLDPSVRSALKEQQKARVAAKAKMAAGEITSEEYSAMYASQPEQVAKAKMQIVETTKRQAAKRAANKVVLDNASGGTAAFGGKS